MRYANETKEKTNGVVYTPIEMADYLAEQMIEFSPLNFSNLTSVSILDPAAGEGELLIAIIRKIIAMKGNIGVVAVGYETDATVASATKDRLSALFPNAQVQIYADDFLTTAETISDKYDFIIANPPYIRTQILGSEKAQQIAQKIGLSGRVDIYYAFLIYAKRLLTDKGISGYITSNKFLTIKAGASVRDFMIDNYHIHTIVDYGDTKLFAASVLPCIVIFSIGQTPDGGTVHFTSIYETADSKQVPVLCDSIFDHIAESGVFETSDGRTFTFQQGTLQDTQKGALWVITSDEKDKWLKEVNENTWMYFSDIGKIRVGIKTTADNVFIGNNWSGDNADLELLQPLITHRDAGQIVSKKHEGWQVLYTHTVINGKKVAIDIEKYPKSKSYLELHYEQLAKRKYLQKAHRNWYEIWVPQNPAAWKNRKIVFRDISECPEFWLDESGAIVNGDCYWIDIDDSVFEETVYLALAVANSKFIEKFYDAKFNTKLYSGKRRYMSQYVEQFPIPFLYSPNAQRAIDLVKKMITECADGDTSRYMEELNAIVDSMFGV